jgi:hypothetical protein
VYAVTLDPSMGTGGDPAAIQVFSATTLEQVAEWRHDRTSIPEQVKLLAHITKTLADVCGSENVFYSLENNSVGEAAIVSINNFGEHNIPGTFISEPGRYRKGLNTNKSTKNQMCAKFKTLIETNKLRIFSKQLVSELKTFTKSGNSYKAKIGKTDDLVMSTLTAVKVITMLGDYVEGVAEQLNEFSESDLPPPFIATYW